MLAIININSLLIILELPTCFGFESHFYSNNFTRNINQKILLQYRVRSKSFQSAHIIVKPFPGYQLLNFDPTATLLVSRRGQIGHVMPLYSANNWGSQDITKLIPLLKPN
jgi:hypothetical protein